MTEDEAIGWTEERFPPSVVKQLRLFVAMIADENDRQNLVSPATLPTIWSRHIVDSLQLIALARPGGRWLDVGTGGGFPGLVVALAGAVPMTLVEPRRRRTEFLRHCVDRLGCDQVDVVTGKVETVAVTAATISARAVASVENLLRAAGHCGTADTRWLLPRGSIDRAELADVAARHGMVFHVEQSVTQQESSIVILEPR